MHQTAKDFFGRPGSTEGILHQEPTRALENGYCFLTKSVLTLASLTSRSFDFLSFSRDDLFSVHYISPFWPYMHRSSQRLCVHYAYLAEVSTGRSQREFLGRVSDSTIEKFFKYDRSTIQADLDLEAHYISHGRRTRQHATYVDELLTTRTTFARAARLRLYLKEKGRLEEEARFEEAQYDKQQRLKEKARIKQRKKRLKRKSLWQRFLTSLLNI